MAALRRLRRSRGWVGGVLGLAIGLLLTRHAAGGAIGSTERVGSSEMTGLAIATASIPGARPTGATAVVEPGVGGVAGAAGPTSATEGTGAGGPTDAGGRAPAAATTGVAGTMASLGMSGEGRGTRAARGVGAIAAPSVSPPTSLSPHVAGAGHVARPETPVAALDTLDFQFYRERVEPIFLRDRGGFGPTVGACATCHVKSATPMPLEPPQEGADGSVYWTEEQSRRNYRNVARLVEPGAPERSRLLRQPLAAAAGGTTFHVGGKPWQTTDDPEWRTIAGWVRNATSAGAAAASAPAPPNLDFDFFRTCVQRIFLDKRPGRMECVNCHSTGARNFARTIPDGRAFWNEEESRQNFGVLLRYLEPGFPERSRFLMHPLHPDAGGDHFHGGGRRWDSRDDPEWRMLAAWVRGETPTCVVGEVGR